MIGWRILQEAAGFERDYLLPVPKASFRGCKRIELKYEQEYAIQNKVLRELDVSGEKLLSHQITMPSVPPVSDTGVELLEGGPRFSR